MRFNRKHTHFNEAMELLCLLPNESTPALMRDLSVDMRLPIHELKMLVKVLAAKGYNVKVMSRGNVMYSCLAEESWSDAQDMGGIYFDKVYAP
jgi:hypothetical protein